MVDSSDEDVPAFCNKKIKIFENHGVCKLRANKGGVGCDRTVKEEGSIFCNFVQFLWTAPKPYEKNANFKP